MNTLEINLVILHHKMAFLRDAKNVNQYLLISLKYSVNIS